MSVVRKLFTLRASGRGLANGEKAQWRGGECDLEGRRQTLAHASRAIRGSVVGRMLGAGWFVCWLTCWLARWLAGWLAGLLTGWPAGSLASCLACLLASCCLLASDWLAGRGVQRRNQAV